MSVADTFIRAGKVRDLYAVGADRLLLVASDRISAFDVVLPTPIPDKGAVLTQLSAFWFRQTEHIVPNHLLSVDPTDVPAELRCRAILCRRAERIDVECTARGYLTGWVWA